MDKRITETYALNVEDVQDIVDFLSEKYCIGDGAQLCIRGEPVHTDFEARSIQIKRTFK